MENGPRNANEIARRLMHYLRSMCATGTVKNRHAHKAHILGVSSTWGVIPMVTVEVVNQSGNATLGPRSGAYPLPAVNINPTGGPINNGVGRELETVLRCARLLGREDAEHSRPDNDGVLRRDGSNRRGVSPSGDAEVRTRQGWTQKSQMGLHVCKDFIPLKTDSVLSRDLPRRGVLLRVKCFRTARAFSSTRTGT